MDAVNIRTIPFLPRNQYFNHVFFISNLYIPPNIPSFTFLFATILEFLQLKYQGKQQTPFETHSFVTSVEIVCLLLYCLGYYVEHRFRSNRRYRIRLRKYVYYSMVFSGSVSWASTISILFPDSIRLILFLIFFVIAAAELVSLLYCAIVRRIAKFSHRRRSSIRGHIATTNIFIATVMSFAAGALVPLLAAAFIGNHHLRLATVVVTVNIALLGFGGLGYLGNAPFVTSYLRVLVGGLFAIGITYGLTRLIGVYLYV